MLANHYFTARLEDLLNPAKSNTKLQEWYIQLEWNLRHNANCIQDQLFNHYATTKCFYYWYLQILISSNPR